MTRRAAVRQHEIERTLRAVRKAGLRVVGVRPDGTVLTAMPGDPAPEFSPPPPASDTGKIRRVVF